MWGDFAVASPNCIEAGVASGSLCQSLRRNPKTTCTKRPPLEDGSTNNFHWVDNGSWWVAISWLTSPPSFSKRIHATVCQQQYCCTRILLTHLSKEGYKHHKHTTTPQQKHKKKNKRQKTTREFLKGDFLSSLKNPPGLLATLAPVWPSLSSLPDGFASRLFGHRRHRWLDP